LREEITFDTGVLIALERRKQVAWDLLLSAERRGIRAVAPQPIVVEWWRGRSDWRERILGTVRVEPLTDALAKLAGEAIAHVKGATAIDAVVMASASLRGGGAVYTSDVRDLSRLQAFFPRVTVFSV
jgi:predicted nucleic acid-binding protein